MQNRLAVDKKRETKEKFDFSDLCIYTSTQYGEDKISETRYPLAIKTIKNCEKLGIKTIVVDSSQNKTFLKQLYKFKNVQIIHNNDPMGAKRREALQKGIDDANMKYFLWLEPEKYDLIKDNSLQDMLFGLKKNGGNIIVPHRKDIDQMPEFFAWIEKRGIKRAKEDVMKSKKEYDLWFGPKMFDRRGAEYFLQYNKDKTRTDLWDSHINPVIYAYKDGLNIQSIDVDYRYDTSEITIEPDKELKQKRIDQYRSILAEILKK